MLRMVGIPARVAAGFAPGSLNRDTRRVPRARPRRPLLGRGLLQRHRLGDVRSDAGRLAGRVAVRRPAVHLVQRRARSTARARASPRPTGAPARAGRAPRTRGAGASPWLLLLPMLLLGGGGLAAWQLARRAQRLGGAELAEAPAGRSCAGRCAGSTGSCPRAPRCSAWSGASGAPPARRRPATRPRCARIATTRATPDGPSLRQRRGLRRDLTAQAGPARPRGRADRDSAGRPAPGLSGL